MYVHIILSSFPGPANIILTMADAEYAVVQYECNIEKLNADCSDQVSAKEVDFRKHRTIGEHLSMAFNHNAERVTILYYVRCVVSRAVRFVSYFLHHSGHTKLIAKKKTKKKTKKNKKKK